MKRTITILRVIFFTPLILSLIFSIACETGVLEEGLWISSDDDNQRIILMAIQEIVTLCNIPIALRLFKFKIISEKLKSSTSQLLKFGTIRIILLSAPLIINTTLYYMYLSATFGYMAIILLLSMIFIYPSTSRCNNEIC